MRATDCDVAVLGAGPYGLAVAAHLRACGIETHVLGDAMAFWRTQMPRGMLLRSPWPASHISAPGHGLTLEHYQFERKVRFSAPVPLEHFVGYGQWFQRKVVPDLDPRRVARIDQNGTGFHLRLDDETVMHACRVVIAGGIAPFAYRPPEFHGCPRELVSHASEHNDLTRFAGKRVAVVGGGQSALESAALLKEGGVGDVEVLVRQATVFVAKERPPRAYMQPLRPVLNAPSGVGPPLVSWLVMQPQLFRRTPRRFQERVARVCAIPGGVPWLRPRLAGVRMTTDRRVMRARAGDDVVDLMLDDGSSRTVDHVLLGTGYHVDISRYEFLSTELLRGIDQLRGFPRLGPGLETSVPGLHIVGAPAAWSYGPLMRFVVGTGFAARALTQQIRQPVAA